jgi:hypothetical protein
MIKRDEVNGPFGLYENGLLQKSQGFYATRELAEERKQILLARAAESRLPQPFWAVASLAIVTPDPPKPKRFKIRFYGDYSEAEVEAIRVAIVKAGIPEVWSSSVLAERVKP